jgi:Uma2 family endonuclease
VNLGKERARLQQAPLERIQPVPDEEEQDDMYTPTLPLTPPDGWTLESLPSDLPKHTELIRGALVMSPQKLWHMAVVNTLFQLLHAQCPEEFMVQREMAVRKSSRSAPEPDLSIVVASAFDWDKSIYLPEDVVLAAEVISPESEERDREDKPVMYAAMGIAAFWLIERGKDDAPMVHEHRLIGGGYRLMRTHIGRLATAIPFPVDVPLSVPTR